MENIFKSFIISLLWWKSLLRFSVFISSLSTTLETIFCIFDAVIQLLSHVQLFVAPWIAACQASLFFTISLSLLKLMFIEWVMPSNHLILCHPLLLLPSIFPSITHLQWVSSWHCVAKVLELQLQPQSFNECSGFISFRIDWFDHLISLLSKELSRVFSSTTIWRHQFFGTQPSLTSMHGYWKNHSCDYMDLCQQSDVSAF